MSIKNRFGSFAQQALKHIYANAFIYLNLVGAIAQKDYLMAFACLKLLAFRVVVGGIKKFLQKHTKGNDVKKDK